MFPRLSFILLLGHVVTSTLTQGSIIKFRQRVPFGKPFRIYFNDPTPYKEGTVSKIDIYEDDGSSMNYIPCKYPIARVSTCKHSGASCESRESRVSSGTILMDGALVTDPYQGYNNFPYTPGKYRVCFYKVTDYCSERELITDCKPLIVKQYKKEMITKAVVRGPAEVKDDERFGFKVKFKTPIAIRGQSIHLYHVASDGETLSTYPLSSVLTACNNYINGCNKKTRKKGEVDIKMYQYLDEKLRPFPVGSYYACVLFDGTHSTAIMKCSEKIEVISSCLSDEVDVFGYDCLPRVLRDGIEMVYVASPQSWHNAWATREVHAEIAHGCGGELASILNREELSQAMALINEHELDTYWIGLSQKKGCKDEPTGCWYWDDGSDLDWTHWDEGQPNGDNDENHVQIHALNDGLWHDSNESDEGYALYIVPLGFSTSGYDCKLHDHIIKSNK